MEFEEVFRQKTQSILFLLARYFKIFFSRGNLFRIFVSLIPMNFLPFKKSPPPKLTLAQTNLNQINDPPPPQILTDDRF